MHYNNFKALRAGRRAVSLAQRRRLRSVSLSLFYKIDRSTQKLTTGRIHSFDIRHSIFDILFFLYPSFDPPAAEYSLFAFLEYLFRLNWLLFRPAAALTPEHCW